MMVGREKKEPLVVIKTRLMAKKEIGGEDLNDDNKGEEKEGEEDDEDESEEFDIY